MSATRGETDTPETNAYGDGLMPDCLDASKLTEQQALTLSDVCAGWYAHARKLERQRDEAVALLRGVAIIKHELDFEIPVSVQEVDESLAGWPFRKPPSFAELVQDRASEMITHHDNAERMLEIGNDLYEAATKLLSKDEPEPSEAMRLIGREVSRETRRYDLREMRRAYNRRGDDE